MVLRAHSQSTRDAARETLANILGSVDMKTHLRPTVEVLQNCLNEVRVEG